MKTFLITLKTVVLFSLITGCSTNSNTTQQEDLTVLNNLKNDIEQLIATGTCSENTTCDYIAFGSKACGGPKSFLVYSTSIDVDLLKEKVATYNDLENNYNIKWSIVSDCSVPSPPTNIECVDGKCTAIY